jgi:hypothetical protein
MIGGVGTESVDQDIDIGKDHKEFIRSSRSPERLRSTPGKVPPVALEVGSFACPRLGERPASARTILSPSSIKDVSV